LILSSAPGIYSAFSSLIRRHLLHRIFLLCPAAAALRRGARTANCPHNTRPCIRRRSTVCQGGRTYRNRSTKPCHGSFLPSQEAKRANNIWKTVFCYSGSLPDNEVLSILCPYLPPHFQLIIDPDLGLLSRFRPALLSSIKTSRRRPRRMKTTKIRSSCC
jgi:hypothetical protein